MDIATPSSAVVNQSTQRRVVLITGCSAGGIGHYLALEFAKEGCKVYASARNTSKIDISLHQVHGIESVKLDVTVDESVKAAVDRIIQESGHIDILVNNAGQSCVGPAVETELLRVQQLFDSNFFGAVRLCQAVAPYMMDRRQGTIVNVGSVGGYVSSPWIGYYGATKAALHSISDSLRIELSPFNVHVIVLAPGTIKTNIVDSQNDEPLIPENSRYNGAMNGIRAMAEFGKTSNPTPADQFASHVVPRILAKRPSAYLTYGRLAMATWAMYYVPCAVRDYLFGRKFGTAKLASELKAGVIA
ncbi:oxidoreductase [Kickxella alabastrina]|uniref:oxidoreductase n=1 Tax=Kickxella alabastrina TaxID=61397 RepID=UPI00221E5764|nr:oxidoreductase [Kickxella alabastrina]KAI7835226.1 oxidoreductase [Kickxella alabastrina]KAJ1947026.1 NADPH-dependent 1-acyl dihydroxyacetone phosphate reductase [Kickxella alabastrina]